MCFNRYEPNESPLDFLHHASHCYATALKSKGNDPNLHLKLGLVLEEKYYAEDLFGQKKESVNKYSLFLVLCRRNYKLNAYVYTLTGVWGLKVMI